MDLRTVKGERAPLALLSIHGSPCLLSGSSLTELSDESTALFAEYNSRREAGEEGSNFLVSKGVGPLMDLYIAPQGQGLISP